MCMNLEGLNRYLQNVSFNDAHVYTTLLGPEIAVNSRQRIFVILKNVDLGCIKSLSIVNVDVGAKPSRR